MANGQNTAAVLGRIAEPSTWAGLAAVAGAVAQLVANPRDAVAWGQVFAGIAAVLVREKGGPGHA